MNKPFIRVLQFIWLLFDCYCSGSSVTAPAEHSQGGLHYAQCPTLNPTTFPLPWDEPSCLQSASAGAALGLLGAAVLTHHPASPSHSSHGAIHPNTSCFGMLPLTPERCFPAQEPCCQLPGCVLPALTSPSSRTSPWLHHGSLQRPRKRPVLGPCSVTGAASSPLEAFGFLHLVRQSSLLCQAQCTAHSTQCTAHSTQCTAHSTQRTAHSTHMSFVFLTQFLKSTHFCSLKLLSARVNHQDWQRPCSQNKHSILECNPARLSSQEAHAL